MMMQRQPKHVKKDGSYDAKSIRQDAYDMARKHCLPDKKTVGWHSHYLVQLMMIPHQSCSYLWDLHFELK